MEKNDKKQDIDAIFERIKSVLNVGTYKHMLEKLNIKRGTFDNWKNRGAIPDSQIIVIADMIGVSRKFLEAGAVNNNTNSNNKINGNKNVIENKVREDGVSLYNGKPIQTDDEPFSDEIASVLKILKTFDIKQQREVLNFVWDMDEGKKE